MKLPPTTKPKILGYNPFLQAASDCMSLMFDAQVDNTRLLSIPFIIVSIRTAIKYLTNIRNIFPPFDRKTTIFNKINVRTDISMANSAYNREYSRLGPLTPKRGNIKVVINSVKKYWVNI